MGEPLLERMNGPDLHPDETDVPLEMFWRNGQYVIMKALFEKLDLTAGY
ncbi:MAG: hypothetical protein ACETVY_00375 [Candidatus Bathyarchaeia archaeon]